MLEHTGYPTVNGYDEFLYEPGQAAPGRHGRVRLSPARRARVHDRALGSVRAPGYGARPPKFVQYYERVSRADLVRLAWWDRDENDGKSFPPWRAFDHPQLGKVEIGGIDPRVGIWNPPFHELPHVCATQSAVFLRVAALAPRVKIARIDRHPMPGGIVRVDVKIDNDGYLGTYGLPSAQPLDFNEPLYARATCEGCELVDLGQAHQRLSHLDGWGHGLHTGANLPSYPGTRGNTSSAWASFLVRGQGTLAVHVGAARTGFITARIVV